MKSKETAIQEIIKLAKAYNISSQDLHKALSSPDSQKAASGDILMQVFSYLGGVFIFSGLATYIYMFWSTLNSISRIAITLGTGLVLYCLALIFYKRQALQKMITPLFLLSAFLIAGGLFVTINEYFQGEDARYAILLVFGLVSIQQLITFFAVHRTTLLFTSILFGTGFFATLFDILNIKWEISAITLGGALLCIAYALGKSSHRAIASLWYFFGSLMFFDGSYRLLENKPYEPLFLGITCLGIYLSTAVRNRTLLLVSVLAMIVYIAIYTEQHFIDSVGWPISLVLLGFIFFGIGFFALQRLKKMR